MTRLPLHQFDHDPLRSPHERQSQAGAACQGPDGDVRAFAPQFLARRVDVIDGQPDMFEPVIGNAGAGAMTSCGCVGAIRIFCPPRVSEIRC